MVLIGCCPGCVTEMNFLSRRSVGRFWVPNSDIRATGRTLDVTRYAICVAEEKEATYIPSLRCVLVIDLFTYHLPRWAIFTPRAIGRVAFL